MIVFEGIEVGIGHAEDGEGLVDQILGDWLALVLGEVQFDLF